MPRTRGARRGESSQTTWEQPLVVSGDEDGEAPPGRITRETKEHLRGMQMSFTKRMYEHAKAFLQGSRAGVDALPRCAAAAKAALGGGAW